MRLIERVALFTGGNWKRLPTARTGKGSRVLTFRGPRLNLVLQNLIWKSGECADFHVVVAGAVGAVRGAEMSVRDGFCSTDRLNRCGEASRLITVGRICEVA